MKICWLTVYALSMTILISSVNSTEETVDISRFIKEVDYSSNFNTTVETSNVFLEFYTPWCGHCKALDKVLVETALSFTGKNLTFAKVDANNEANKELASLLHVEAYPTFFYISSGQYMLYQGKKTVKGFSKFLNQELNTNLTKYQLSASLSNLNSLAASDKRGLLVFVGNAAENLSQFNVHRRVAEMYHKKVNYVWTNSEEFRSAFNVNSNNGYSLVFFNYLYNSGKFANGYLIDMNSHVDEKGRIKLFTAPIFNEIKAKELKKYIDGGFTSIILVHNDKNPENLNSATNKLINRLTPIAELNKGDFFFSKMDFLDEALTPIFENFELSETELPTLILVEVASNGDLHKFKLREPLSVNSFTQFLSQFRSHSLPKIINSEPVPSEIVNQYGVHKVVRNTLNSTVLDNNVDEFVILYCLENSHNCDEVRQRFYNISQRFNKSSNLRFAEYEANLNENDVIDINTVPEIIYFPSNSQNKLTGLKRFSGNFTSPQIIEFISQNVQESNLVATPGENEETLWKNETLIEASKISEEIEERDHHDEDRDQPEEVNDEQNDDEEDQNEDKQTNSTSANNDSVKPDL